jgi:hypothetical protein
MEGGSALHALCGTCPPNQPWGFTENADARGQYVRLSLHSPDDLIYNLSQRRRWPDFHACWRVPMLGLWQRGTMGCVVISKNKFLVYVLVVIGMHQPGFR